MSSSAEILETLRHAHPKTHVSDQTLAVYAEDLADINPELLERAVTELRRTLKFFPSIAEIRQAAAAAILDEPEPSVAFNQAATSHAGMHPLVREAKDVVGDGWHWRTQRAVDLERQFTKAYAEIRARELRRLQVGAL